jgi:hypothetical protein
MRGKLETLIIKENIKFAIVSAVTANTDIAFTVSRTVNEALQKMAGNGNTGRQVTALTIAVASGAIGGAIKTGCDLELAAYGLVVGILRGTLLVGTEVVDTITRTAGIVITAVVESEGDLQSTATGLVRGAIHGAKGIGINIQAAAAAAADGALNAVGDVRSTAYQTVLAGVIQPIDGITVAPKLPVVSLN